MNLLYTLTTYPPSTGGAQLHQHLLAQTLLPSHNVQVVSHWDSNRTDWLMGTTLRAPAQAHDYIIDGINVHRMGLSVWEKLTIAPFVLAYYPLMQVALPPIADCIERQLRPFAEKADLVHNVRIGREGLSYASFRSARKNDIPFVLTPVHHPRWVGWRYRAFIRLYHEADAVIALTNAEKRILTSLGVQEERITVTGTGPVLAIQANPTHFLSKYKLSGPVILFIGQHYPYKGYKQVLKAAKFVWRQMPEAEFVFVGPQFTQSDIDFAEYIDPRIHKLGAIDLQTKTDALAACTVFCMPSTQESFGIVYTEAWSFGKPVIGCNIPAVAEVIDNGVNGYLVAQEPQEIADRICHLLLNPGDANSLGMNGQSKVNIKYNWQEVARLTEQAYLSLIG